VETAPSDWASHLPLEGVQAGTAELFADSRVEWAMSALGGIAGMHCLELGPLEGGHSYMLEKGGARRVIAVEANRDAYLKCLIVKELLGLQRCSFLYGDAIRYLETTDAHFDACLCSGVLYHLVEPVRLIHLIAQHARRLHMWTHYYDPTRAGSGEPWHAAFARGETLDSDHGGFKFRLYRHDYGVTRSLGRFWGGTRPYAYWLTLDDLLGALEHFGWGGIETQIDTKHPHGSAVNLVAVRR
jgi:hypothetical protein